MQIQRSSGVKRLQSLIIIGGAALSSCSTTNSGRDIAVLPLTAQNEYLVEAQVRGRTLRLRVDPSAPGNILINGSVARSLGLEGSINTTFQVGPVQLKGTTRTERITVTGVEGVQPIMWFDHEMVSGADGTINPARLSARRVLMKLGNPVPGEIEFALPMEFDEERGLYHSAGFARDTLLARFTLSDRLTTATGATAAELAKRAGGEWAGDIFTYPVRYGIRRPVRMMLLNQPVTIMRFELSRIAVRIRDNVGGHILPRDFQPEAQADDVTIVGKAPRRRFGEAQHWLMIGRDDLGGCSSVTYDRKSSSLIFRCRPAHLAGAAI